MNRHHYLLIVLSILLLSCMREVAEVSIEGVEERALSAEHFVEFAHNFFEDSVEEVRTYDPTLRLREIGDDRVREGLNRLPKYPQFSLPILWEHAKVQEFKLARTVTVPLDIEEVELPRLVGYAHDSTPFARSKPLTLSTPTSAQLVLKRSLADGSWHPSVVYYYQEKSQLNDTAYVYQPSIVRVVTTCDGEQVIDVRRKVEERWDRIPVVLSVPDPALGTLPFYRYAIKQHAK